MSDEAGASGETVRSRVALAGPSASLMAALQGRQGGGGGGGGGIAAALKKATPSAATTTTTKAPETSISKVVVPEGKLYVYDETQEAFVFQWADASLLEPRLIPSNADETATTTTTAATANDNTHGDIGVPLAPCIYRMTDYTLAKKEPVTLHRCLLKLGVLRCLQRERDNLNQLLQHRFSNTSKRNSSHNGGGIPRLEEDELGKARFMELLSNCGVYQKVAELILTRAAQCSDALRQQRQQQQQQQSAKGTNETASVTMSVPQVRVPGLDDFLNDVERLTPALAQARTEIETTQTVSFFPGLGELFCPGSQLITYPEGMEGSPVGCTIVQSWYVEEQPPPTSLLHSSSSAAAASSSATKVKRRFVLVVEFIVSVGSELVFVAASDVYPEFHDPTRNVALRDLTHRKLLPTCNRDDAVLLQRLQLRGEFYASVATHNHYLEYYAGSFYPILGGGWTANAIRPLTKGGRVMVDVQRGILEGHLPVRGSADGMSDTVKEAIKLFEQSKRTGVAVPFRTCLLPESFANTTTSNTKLRGAFKSTTTTPKGSAADRGHQAQQYAHDYDEHSDRAALWQSWPMLTGFSFTARVWGKLLLGMPKIVSTATTMEPAAGTPHATVATTPHAHDAPHHHSSFSSLSSPAARHSQHGTGSVLLKRPSQRKRGGVQVGGLGGEGACGNCGYIHFQEYAFEQLVLAEDKKELIRAVARNAGGGSSGDSGSAAYTHDGGDHTEQDFSVTEYDDGDGFGHDGDPQEKEVDNDEEEEADQDDLLLLNDDDMMEDAGLDVVANKGGASIFLLHGPPGCGKTLTAEAIAELLKKPLYIVTAGDLGITAAEVEKTLGSVLELCQTWDALVLIDEADIFLEARNSAEIQRNALVCVMLRLLEYYSGCLFLSSNRAASSIDPAIASRITVMLGYPPLDVVGRAKVWKNLVELVPALPVDPTTGAVVERIARKACKFRVAFSKDDYHHLAESYQLNGRQIKNSIVLARALARERGSPLSMPILQRAVTAVAGDTAATTTTTTTAH